MSRGLRRAHLLIWLILGPLAIFLLALGLAERLHTSRVAAEDRETAP